MEFVERAWSVRLPICTGSVAALDSIASGLVPALERVAAPQTKAHLRRARGGHRIAVSRQLLLRVLAGRTEPAACVPPGRGVRKLSALFQRSQPDFAVRSHALCRPENLPGGAAHETRPDEHGVLHREPRTISGSHFCRVFHAYSGPAEDPWRHTEIHFEEGGGGSASARDHLPEKNGFPDTAAPMAARPTRRAAVCRPALGRRTGGGALRHPRSGAAHPPPSFRLWGSHGSHMG